MALSTAGTSSGRRSFLPSRPMPSKFVPSSSDTAHPLDPQDLIGMSRVGGASVTPDKTLASFGVRQYDFEGKKWSDNLYIMDMVKAESASEDALQQHEHITQVASDANSPVFSPCGNFVAFLSDRGENKTSAVWIMPARGPGEAKLLKEFPLPVGDLTWSHEAGGIVVSADVYVDQQAANGNAEGKDSMATTAARDKALKDDKALGGLNAVVFKKLPIREWDRWLDAKMSHPFFLPVHADSASPAGYVADEGPAVDLLAGAPSAVPSGAFGGSEDWTVSSGGAVAFSARPPLCPQEAWTTNRHIYLKTTIPSLADVAAAEQGEAGNYEALMGTCITADNPGYDTNPVFSPDGTQLAWLSMAGPQYEMDAIGIKVYDLKTATTRTVLEAGKDWDYSPVSLAWSDDGEKLLFAADRQARMPLCSVDVATGAGAEGCNIVFLHEEGSSSLCAEVGDGRVLFSRQSLTSPPELFSCDGTSSAAEARQLTHFNREKLSNLKLGEPVEFFYEGAKGEQVQAWLIRPAGFKEGDGKTYPLACVVHGGPQGSTGDDWQYRWNLQSYASQGFAVLAPNFHGSTGFGHEFCREISGNWEVGGVDSVAGVGACLAEHGSWIDGNRVVALGASYGGFTMNWLNGNAPEGMFRALVCHCGTYDLKSSYCSTEELFFMETEFGGVPYGADGTGASNPESPYVKYTPSAKAHLWKTPTLVIHGARDFRLVESEGIATFTALQRQGVPSELLYLPTENHHCLNPQNSMVWHETVLNWIRQWTATEE